MSTFKDFLLFEDSRTQQISKQQAVQWARQNSLQYLHTYKHEGTGIYRGVWKKQKDFLFGDPTDHSPRQSAHTSNVYTLLVDNLPSWNEYPKRSESFICSTSERVARFFGSTYLACPTDSTPIGVAPAEDFWVSFSQLEQQTGIVELPDLNNALKRLLRKFTNTPTDPTAFKSFENLHYGLQQLKQKLDTDGPNKYLNNITGMGHKLLKIIVEHDNDPFKALNTLLNPQTNGFSLTTANQFSTTKSVETWFSSPALFVGTDYDSFVDKALQL